MIHLRLIVPADRSVAVVQHLSAHVGVAHVVHLESRSASPAGELVLCDVSRESADEVIEWLQDLGVHRAGAISLDSVDAVVSDSAATAEAAAPGAGSDALIWEQLESTARAESELTSSFLVFMGIAAVIAGVGILLDSPVLIVGAMVVGPEYGPLAALCVSVVRRRRHAARAAVRTLAVGFGVAALAALVATTLFRLTGLAPDHYELGKRELTAFISRPDGLAAVVAVLAGIAGMLSITEARAGALVGVLVSVTTIPAIANVGTAAAYLEWPEVRGAAVQLAVNVVGLVVAGVATLAIQSRMTTRRRLRGQRPSVPG